MPEDKDLAGMTGLRIHVEKFLQTQAQKLKRIQADAFPEEILEGPRRLFRMKHCADRLSRPYTNRTNSRTVQSVS